MLGSMLVMGISVFFEEVVLVDCGGGKPGLRSFGWGCAERKWKHQTRGTRGMEVALDRASGSSDNVHAKKVDEGIIDDGGERDPKRRRMKESEREGLIWRQML